MWRLLASGGGSGQSLTRDEERARIASQGGELQVELGYRRIPGWGSGHKVAVLEPKACPCVSGQHSYPRLSAAPTITVKEHEELMGSSALRPQSFCQHCHQE